jgi:hypothetical protein
MRRADVPICARRKAMGPYRLAVARIALNQAREQAQKRGLFGPTTEKALKELTPRQESRDWDKQYRRWILK